MINFMSSSPSWVNDIFLDASGNPQTVKNDNIRIASTRIMKVVLARWVVFRTFIEVAKELKGALYSDLRREWLFLQVLPLVHFNGDDPFIELIDSCLRGVQAEELELLHKRLQLAPEKILGPDVDRANGFFYVLDEAQVAGEQYMGAFSDDTGKWKRPVLRPIIQYMAPPSDSLVKIIVSGTGFSLQYFNEVLTSAVAKEGNPEWEVVRETGDFMDKDSQMAYFSRYFPPSFLASHSCNILKSRMYEWLRGRYVVPIVLRL